MSGRLDLEAVRRLVRAGRRDEARRMVLAHLRTHPKDIPALLWFAALAPERAQAEQALRYVLQLDPTHRGAREALARLQRALRVVNEMQQPNDRLTASTQQGEATPSATLHAAVTPPSPQQEAAVSQPTAFRIAKKEQKSNPLQSNTSKTNKPESNTTTTPSTPTQRPDPQQVLSGRQAVAYARQIVWPFRGLNRPLGTLLDVGHVTKEDLRWAVEHARDPKVRWAAAVLLREDELSDVSLTVGEVSSATFPFRGLRGGMGALLEQGRIGLGDLAYTVHRAYSPRVRAAAALKGWLVLTGRWSVGLQRRRHDKPSAQPGPAKRQPATRPTPAPVAPSPAALVGDPGPLRIRRGDARYLVRQEQRFQRRTVRRAAALWLLFFLVSWGLLLPLTRWAKGQLGWGLWAEVIGSVLILAFTAVITRWLIPTWLDPAIARRNAVRRGRSGEERLESFLRRHLDGRWTLYRNVHLPDGRNGDLDAVLVGPRGVFVLEVKTYTGQYRYQGDAWYFKRWGKWARAKANPSQQAFHNALRLADYLREQGMEVFVEARVVWAGEAKLWIDGQPQVLVWDLRRPQWILRDLGRGNTLPLTTLAEVRQALDALFSPAEEEREP